VILKESKGQHPINNPLTHFKTMTELKSQAQIIELTDKALEDVAAGKHIINKSKRFRQDFEGVKNFFANLF